MKKFKVSNLPKPNATSQQLIVPLALEQVKVAFKVCAELLHEEMTDAKADYWSKFLAQYPAQAVIWAFDNWTRNAEYFPKPKDITQLVSTWRESQENEVKTCGGCDSGWIIVNPEAKRSEQKAKRCDCMRSA